MILLHAIGKARSLLFNNGESSEEGTRNIVAECLGRLTLLNPQQYLAELQSQLSSPSSSARATVVMALRFTFTEQADNFDALQRPIMAQFGTLIRDADLVRRGSRVCCTSRTGLTAERCTPMCGRWRWQTVQRVSLQALNSIAHNKPAIVRALLGELFPVLFNATVIRVRPRLLQQSNDAQLLSTVSF